jgi:L-aspartate oxidase
LIIGSGIAALRAAVALAGAGDVLVLTKADPLAGNTGYAQGGIAAAVGPDDSPSRHLADTLAAGDGLCDERAVAVLVDEGPHYVRELIDWGAAFDRDADGRPALAIEGAHSVRRVLHAHDATGREIGRVLWERVKGISNVRVQANARAVGIVVEDGACVGVRYRAADGSIALARARRTLIATGGAGQVFRETTNPPVATGDGVAIAYNAGAAVADLEFVQFHPTALHVEGQPRFLLSEALRGEGARIVNADGEAFMTRVDPLGDLAPRDRVSRAIVREAERTGRDVYLTLQHLDPAFVHARFPLISDACRRAGLDLARDRIPIAPAAHYVMGGVLTDLDGRTTIPGLYAAGEVACTGVHGANRLASNSLLEGLVFGARAGPAMRQSAEQTIDALTLRSVMSVPSVTDRSGSSAFTAAEGSVLSVAEPSVASVESVADPSVSSVWSVAEPSVAAAVQRLMSMDVGVFREARGLAEAVEPLDAGWRHFVERSVEDPASVNDDAWRAGSLLTVGRLIARAAKRREESRGGHYRLDFPDRDDRQWKRRLREARAV